MAAGKGHDEVGPAILEHEGIPEGLAAMAEALPIGRVANDRNAVRAGPVFDRSSLATATSMNEDANGHALMKPVQFPLDQLIVAMAATAAHDDPHGARRAMIPVIVRSAEAGSNLCGFKRLASFSHHAPAEARSPFRNALLHLPAWRRVSSDSPPWALQADGPREIKFRLGIRLEGIYGL
jgi:hypothetical protein